MKLLAHATTVGFIAAFAVFISSHFHLQAWALFLAWVGYFVFGPSVRDASFAWLQTMIGLGLAAGLIFVSLLMQPQLGQWSLVVVVFVVASSLTFMERFSPMNNIPAYYVGMIIVFASGFAPNAETVLRLAIPTTVGFMLGWLTVTLRARLDSMQAATG